MPSMTVELRNVEGTQAAMGWAGAHTIVVDRPDGRAGGRGLGFNGGQLLALAIGGRFCHELRYAPPEVGAGPGRSALPRGPHLDGSPLLATRARMTVSCEMLDGSDPQALIDEARRVTMVTNSLIRGFPVAIEAIA